MKKLAFSLAFVMAGFLVMSANASDITAGTVLETLKQAEGVCPGVCAKHDCAWSGEWKATAQGQDAACDCGPERVRSIPGGVFRDQAGADAACPEVCDLQGDRYTGHWAMLAGGYSMCGCAYVADWCEPKN